MQPSQQQPSAPRRRIDSCNFSSSSSSDCDNMDEWVTVTESESNLARAACSFAPDASSWLILDDNSRFVHDDAGRLVIRQITPQPTADPNWEYGTEEQHQQGLPRLVKLVVTPESAPPATTLNEHEVDITPHLNDVTEAIDSTDDSAAEPEEETTEACANDDDDDDDDDDSEWVLSKIHSRRHVRKSSNKEQQTLRFRCEEADYDDDGSAHVDTYEYLCSWKGHSERTWELRSTLEAMDYCVAVDLYDQGQIRQACAQRGQTTATNGGETRASMLLHPYHAQPDTVAFHYLFIHTAQQMLETKLREMSLSIFSQELIEDRPLQQWCVHLYYQKSFPAAAAPRGSSVKMSLALAFEAMQPRDVATAVNRMKASLSKKTSTTQGASMLTPPPAADATFHTAIQRGTGILVSIVLVRTKCGADNRIRCVAPMWFIRVCPTSASPHAGEVCHSKRELKQQPRRVKDFYR